MNNIADAFDDHARDAEDEKTMNSDTRLLSALEARHLRIFACASGSQPRRPIASKESNLLRSKA
jgi:hypothetical protein